MLDRYPPGSPEAMTEAMGLYSELIAEVFYATNFEVVLSESSGEERAVLTRIVTRAREARKRFAASRRKAAKMEPQG